MVRTTPGCAGWKRLRPADVEDDAVITALRSPESGWRDRGVRLSRGRDREAPTRAPTAARHYTPKTLAATRSRAAVPPKPASPFDAATSPVIARFALPASTRRRAPPRRSRGLVMLGAATGENRDDVLDPAAPDVRDHRLHR